MLTPDEISSGPSFFQRKRVFYIVFRCSACGSGTFENRGSGSGQQPFVASVIHCSLADIACDGIGRSFQKLVLSHLLGSRRDIACHLLVGADRLDGKIAAHPVVVHLVDAALIVRLFVCIEQPKDIRRVIKIL
ncbi:hypothetical protein GD416_32530 [Burkholderia sp. BE24]|nr:hypothetical protein [Burkholderia sp. BE24]